jgi:energy-converting hydrogenase Eha subunit E
MDVGYRYKLIGDSDMMTRVRREITIAIVMAIILIYMVLAAEFESFSQPLVIMVSLPFAIIGAVLGLLVANQTVNMMSMIGFTMLLGLVTKNAILLCDYANPGAGAGTRHPGCGPAGLFPPAASDSDDHVFHPARDAARRTGTGRRRRAASVYGRRPHRRP